ncbi:MAG: hypothetical protein LBR07_09850 [Puniceicoccales bacterium]|jgi:tetratricopeptide (TPR) repeat protein|nr:hypothetical protein [Puniceicoccales bacterium]
MSRPSSRPAVSTLAGLVALAAAFPALPFAALDAAAAPAPAAQQLPPVEILFNKAEKNFLAGKLKEAVPQYTQLIEKHANDIPNVAAYALFHLRLASCYHGIAGKFDMEKEKERELAMQYWALSEKELKIFLDTSKYPKGTDNLLDNNDNFRLRAQITLAEVLSKQMKWNDAINQLTPLLRRGAIDVNEATRTRAAVMLSRVHEGQAAEMDKPKREAILRSDLEKLLLPRIASKYFLLPENKEAGTRIVEIYTKLGMTKEAKQLNEEINAAISGNPLDLVMANFRRLDIGDSLFEQGERLGDGDTAGRARIYGQALATYQETLRSKAIERLIVRAEKTAEQKVTIARQKNPNPDKDPAHKEAIERAEHDRDVFADAVKKFREGIANYDAFLSYRIALCLLELKRPWEALVAFNDVFDNAPKNFAFMDIARFFHIRALREVHRNKEAIAACRDFLNNFKKSQQRGEVAVQLGEISFENEDYQEAIRQFRWARENVALEDTYKEWVDWYICVSLFRFVEWKLCGEEVAKFIANWPKSKQLEQMYYMRGLCAFYQGQYKPTLEAMDDYLTRYKNGNFVPDARYRLAIVKLNLNNVKGAYDDAEAWLRDYKSPPTAIADDIERQRPEVLTLIGDIYFRYSEDTKKPNDYKQDNLKKAIAYYIEAAKAAKNNQYTFDHVVRELNRRLPQQGEWAKLCDIHVTFYNWNKDSPKALDHLYWILRSIEKMGKTEKERRAEADREKIKIPDEYLTQKPEQILANAILRNISDPKKENVEMLMSELASRVIRKSRLAIRKAQTAENAVEALENAKKELAEREEAKAKADANFARDDSSQFKDARDNASAALDRARKALTDYEAALVKARKEARDAAEEQQEPFRSQLLSLKLKDPSKSQQQINAEVNALVRRIADSFIQETLKPRSAKEKNPNLTAARRYFARAEVARLSATKKDLLKGPPEAYLENIGKIPTLYKAEELSPALLAASTDYLVLQAQRAQIEKKPANVVDANYRRAAEYAQYILDHHRDSLDYADTGFLARAIVLLEHEGKPREAHELLKEADDYSIIDRKEKDIRLTDARAIIEYADQVAQNSKATAEDKNAVLKLLEEAEKSLKRIGATKIWRGEATAWSLYYLGRVEEARGQLERKNRRAEAINYYRRCFLAWKNFGTVTAKAYLRVIACFEQMHDKDGVGGTIWSFLHDEVANKQPESEYVRGLQPKYSAFVKPPKVSETPAEITITGNTPKTSPTPPAAGSK